MIETLTSLSLDEMEQHLVNLLLDAGQPLHVDSVDAAWCQALTALLLDHYCVASVELRRGGGVGGNLVENWRCRVELRREPVIDPVDGLRYEDVVVESWDGLFRHTHHTDALLRRVALSVCVCRHEPELDEQRQRLLKHARRKAGE